MKQIRVFVVLVLAFLPLCGSFAQQTIGVSGGVTSSTFRPYPSQVTRSVTGLHTYALSWRYYTAQRYVGGFGIDVEFMQRGYSYAPYASYTIEGEDYDFYTRWFNSIMVPLIWQPHIYMINNKVRIFMDAAVTFSYNMSSTYENKVHEGLDGWEGVYEYKAARDNRFGYGLMGGFGANYIYGRLEAMIRARYYFGYSDILKNRNKYYGNNNDGYENPFYYTPTRSPVDNISVSVGLSYRIGRSSGYDSWKVKSIDRVKIGREFNYSGKI